MYGEDAVSVRVVDDAMEKCPDSAPDPVEVYRAQKADLTHRRQHASRMVRRYRDLLQEQLDTVTMCDRKLEAIRDTFECGYRGR